MIKDSTSVEDAEMRFRREMSRIQAGIDNLLSNINSKSQIKIEIKLSGESDREKEKVIQKMIKEKIVSVKSEVSSDIETIFEVVEWLASQGVIGILMSSDQPHILRNKDFLEILL